MSRLRSVSGLLLSVIGLLLIAPSAQAQYFVGASASCPYHHIQDAINSIISFEHSNNYYDYYIYVADGSYNEVLNIDGTGIGGSVGSNNPFGLTGAYVVILGGLDQACTGTPDPSGTTTITASGKSGSAMFIHDHSTVYLNYLTLTGANNTNGGATGGGINFTGSGLLDISNVDISGNQASYGAGIYANGAAAGLTLNLHTGTRIYGNFARNAGGGIRIDGTTYLSALESPTIIYENTANTSSSDGVGGGLQIYGSGATADIAASYYGSTILESNHAKNGGGVAVQNGGGLRLFSAAGPPASIEDNTATVAGGGLFVDAGSVCGSSYAINGIQPA